MSEKKHIVIGLAGNPNAGKTSLFNKLTGLRAHVGNYPGVTVEQKWGELTHKGRTIKVVDLPGTYSLNSYSLDERVARDFLINERPDMVVNVIDTTNLERNLYLTLQFLELGLPTVLAMNMMDISTAQGLTIDMAQLETSLGVSAIPVVATSGQGLYTLLDKIIEVADASTYEWKPLKINYGLDIEEAINAVVGDVEKSTKLVHKTPARWLAIKYLESDPEIMDLISKKTPDIATKAERVRTKLAEHIRITTDDEIEGVMTGWRYGFLTSLGRTVVTRTRQDTRKISDTIDKVLLNRFFSPFFFLISIYALYSFTFWAADPVAGWVGAFFEFCGGLASTHMPEGLLKDLVIEGLIGGVGGVMGFVPFIAFMFVGISILEDTGYMARVAFILDRIFRAFGLHGNSVVALIVGGGIAGGCAIPGVMATRTLRDPKERIATILVTPFMNCGAKVPVFLMLVAAFFSSYETEVMMGMTLFGWAIALISAKILRTFVLPGKPAPFVLELPPYRMPTLLGVLLHAMERTWLYVKKAGTVIVGITILIWVIMTFPKLPAEQAILLDSRVEIATGKLEEARLNYAPNAQIALLEAEKESTKQAASSAGLRYSLAGRIGQAIEPASELIGFDWRTNIALVAGFAAKEVVLSAMGTAYAIEAEAGEESEAVEGTVAVVETTEAGSPTAVATEAVEEPDEEEAFMQSLSSQLANDPAWTPLAALSLMIFVMIYAPCFVTIAVIYREIGAKWAAFSLVGSTVYAYLICLVLYQGGKMLGLGLG